MDETRGLVPRFQLIEKVSTCNETRSVHSLRARCEIFQTKRTKNIPRSKFEIRYHLRKKKKLAGEDRRRTNEPRFRSFEKVRECSEMHTNAIAWNRESQNFSEKKSRGVSRPKSIFSPFEGRFLLWSRGGLDGRNTKGGPKGRTSREEG